MISEKPLIERHIFALISGSSLWNRTKAGSQRVRPDENGHDARDDRVLLKLSQPQFD